LDIITGEHRPGGQLDEVALTYHYRAGRAAVRDALFRLDLEGLVHRRPRVGTTVADLNPLELQQVFEARLIIEVQCAGFAARLASAEELATIRGAFDGVERVIAARDFKTLIRMDQQFHQAIAKGAHNRYLVNAVTMLHNSTLRYSYFALQRRTAERMRAAIDQHFRACAALERRDPAAAEREVRKVVVISSDIVNEIIGRVPASDGSSGIL